MKKVNLTDYSSEVAVFSLEHEKPAWMTELRTTALKNAGESESSHINRMKFHHWPLSSIHMESYVSPEGNVASLDRMKNNPLIARQGFFHALERLPVSLAEQGVISTDIFTTLQEHLELVKEYYMTKAVLPEEGKLTAAHVTSVSNGVFLYVPKNAAAEEPIESLFIQDSDSSQSLFKHVLIIADNHSELSYLERSQSIGHHAEKVSKNIVVEVIAKGGVKVKYSAVDRLGQTVATYTNRHGYIMRGASVGWALSTMNDGDVVIDLDSSLVGEGIHSEVKVIAVSVGKQTQDIDTRVANKTLHLIGHILQHEVIRERGTLTLNEIGHILERAKGAGAQQEGRVLMLLDKAHGGANSIFLIDENEVTAGHAASVGRANPEEIYYLMSHGLCEEEAERLVIHGFLGPIITAIPAKEVQNEFVEVTKGKLNA